MRILVDQNLTVYVRDLLPGHDVGHTYELGWHTLSNGELLNQAEKAGFDVLLTADRSIPKQNRMEGRKIALVVLSTNRWPTERLGVKLPGPTRQSRTPGSVGEVPGNRHLYPTVCAPCSA